MPTAQSVQPTSEPSADKEDESRNESKEDKFVNHKARPIYSIDAREAPLLLATHFPGDSIDSSRLTIRFEPTTPSGGDLSSKEKGVLSLAPNLKQRKKSNRKGNRHHEDSPMPDEGKQVVKRTNAKGMVYLEISNVKKEDNGVYRYVTLVCKTCVQQISELICLFPFLGAEWIIEEEERSTG